MPESYAAERLTLTALRTLPPISAGDDLTSLIVTALGAEQLTLIDGDVLVIAQKIVSKAEGRTVELASVVPSPEAVAVARTVHKDSRLVEVILRESTRIVRQVPGILIVEHRLGFVMANSGVDQSNAPAGHAVLLPLDPDRSAAALVDGIRESLGVRVAVIVSDSIGRPWRNGAVGHALGVAGLPPVIDLRGTRDLAQRSLEVTQVGLADEVASAASLLMGQAGEGRPVVIVRGLRLPCAADGLPLLRDKELNLFP